MVNERRYGALAVMVVLLLTGSWLMPGDNCNAQGQISPTSVELTVTPETGYVDMTTNGSFYFEGQVSVTTLPIIVTTVNISVYAGDWVNETDQSNFVLTGNRDAQFNVAVYAPFDSLAGSRQVVEITATWTTSRNEDGSEKEKVTAIVQQFFRVNIYAPQTYRSAKPGESFDWKGGLYVNNNGNGPDTFSINLQNHSALLSEGWTFTLDKKTLTLDPGEQAVVGLDLSIPLRATLGLVMFEINATSEGSAGTGDEKWDDIVLQIRVKEEDTNGGNGNGNGTTNGNGKTDTICSTELIPLMAVLPLGAAAFTVRRIGRRKGR